MSRIEEIITRSDLLAGKSISWQKLNGSYNSCVYKLSCDINHYALKIYAPKHHPAEAAERMTRENNFLTQCALNHITNVPRILESGFEMNYSILTWICGTHPSIIGLKV